jgi:hypothetical protein
MADCNGKIGDLTPYEAYRCIVDADLWKTIGDWIEIIYAFAVLPAQLVAQLASYIFPFLFLRALMRKFSDKHVAIIDHKSRRAKNFWGAYMLVSAAFALYIGNGYPFVLFTGIWEAICGVTIFILGPSWWASSATAAAKG